MITQKWKCYHTVKIYNSSLKTLPLCPSSMLESNSKKSETTSKMAFVRETTLLLCLLLTLRPLLHSQHF